MEKSDTSYSVSSLVLFVKPVNSLIYTQVTKTNIILYLYVFKLMEKIILLIFLTNKICLGTSNHYLKMAKTDVVGHDLAFFPCGEGR